MFCSLRAIALGFVATTASAVMWSVCPALAAEPCRELSPPYLISSPCVATYAGYYVPYAFLSAATNGGKKDLLPPTINEILTENAATKDVQTGGPSAEPALGLWRYQFDCYDPSDECDSGPSKRYRGPAFQVWAHQPGFYLPANIPWATSGSCDQVSIDFAGSRVEFSWDALNDWRSNLRFIKTFIPQYLSKNLKDKTRYHELKGDIDLVMNRIKNLPCYKDALSKGSPPIIVSVGHSLGGGLAQFAALAATHEPRIEKVFAFETLPETGTDLIESDTLKENSEALEIDRVNVVGDIMWKTRDLLRSRRYSSKEFYFLDSDGNPCGPLIRNVNIEGSLIRQMDAEAENQIYQYGGRLARELAPIFRRTGVFSTYSAILKHDIGLVAAQLVALSHLGNDSYNPEAPTECPTRYYARTHPRETTPTSAPIATLPPLAAPQQAQVSESGAQQGLNAPAQTQQLGDRGQRPRALFASDYAQAADLGARRAHYPLGQTQLAVLGGSQAQPARGDPRVTNLGVRRQFYALAPSQLDQRQAPSMSAYAPVGDIGARRAHSAPAATQPATVDQRQALSAPPRMQVADLNARRPPSAVRHHIGRSHQYAQNTAVARPGNVKARIVATRDYSPSDRKSAIASML
jgi:hypothetical protein